MKNKQIILGTVQLGMPYGINNTTGQPDKQSAFEILNTAKKMGVEILDTADAYGSSYEIINAFHKSHTPFRLMTKFKLDQSVRTINEAFARTKKDLHFNKLFCYSFHTFKDLQSFKEIAELNQLKKDKLVDHIGVSVYGNDEFQTCIALPFVDVIQIPFNLLDNFRLRGQLLELAKKNNKIIHVRSIFLQGLFYKTDISGKLAPLAPVVMQLKEIALKYQMDIGELALRYALSIPQIDGILIGVESVAQLEKNMLYYKKGALPEDSVNLIHQIIVADEKLLSPVNWK